MTEPVSRSTEIRNFLIVSGMCVILDLIIYAVLVGGVQIPPIRAMTIAAVIALGVNYTLTRRFVFACSKRVSLREVVLFYVSGGVAIILNAAIMWVLFELGAQFMLARIIAIALVTIANYEMRRRILIGSL